MSSPYRAKIYETPEGSEILGMLLLPYFDNLASHQLDPILKKHGLSKEMVDGDSWYPLQVIYDISKEVSPTGTDTVDIALGKSYAKFVIEQYQVTGIEQYLEETLNQVVRAGVRNVPEEYGFEIKKMGERHYHVVNNTPGANGLYYGTFWEACRLLRNEDEEFLITALVGLGDDDYLTPGTFEIKWG